jgi:hypothetical protein
MRKLSMKTITFPLIDPQNRKVTLKNKINNNPIPLPENAIAAYVNKSKCRKNKK